MPWTATLREKVAQQGVLTLLFELQDSVSGEIINYTIQNPSSVEDIKARVRNYIADISARYAGFTALPTIGTVLDYSATAPPASTYGSYSVSALAMAKSASKNYLTIFNADPALIVTVTGIVLAQETTAAVTGLTRGYRLFKCTAAPTGGTLATAEKLDSTFPNLDTDIVSRVNGVTATPVGGSIAVAGITEDENFGVTYDMLAPLGSVTLRQNQGLIVQQDSTAGTGVLSVNAYFQVG